MRIRSDFHDYYDHALGYGIDDRIFYERFTKEVEIKIRTSLSWPVGGLFVGVLGFCGRIYPFAEVLRHEEIEDLDWGDAEYRVVERYYAFTPDDYAEKAEAWRDSGSWFNATDKIRWRTLKQFYLDWSFESDEIFVEHKTPVWVIPKLRPHREGFINPKLTDFGFERVKDAISAFQEIGVYLGNTLRAQETEVKIDDKNKIEQHGFDVQLSFRKDKKSWSCFAAFRCNW